MSGKRGGGQGRDEAQTARVARAAVHQARGDRAAASARLRAQVAEYLRAALEASAAGAGDERVQQLIDGAARRLRAAGLVDRGEEE